MAAKTTDAHDIGAVDCDKNIINAWKTRNTVTAGGERLLRRDECLTFFGTIFLHLVAQLLAVAAASLQFDGADAEVCQLREPTGKGHLEW